MVKEGAFMMTGGFQGSKRVGLSRKNEVQSMGPKWLSHVGDRHEPEPVLFIG